MSKKTVDLRLPSGIILKLPGRKNYLFIVGIDEYEHLENLNNAVRDAEAIAGKLCDYFDCEIAPLLPLFNRATRSNLAKRFRALDTISNKMNTPTT
ncbi:MAG: hypothetical protein R3B47_21255 [Bacteroidia bacterium]